MKTKTFKTLFLGCRTNQAEIENIQKDLIKSGFKIAKSSSSPDVIIVNTCIVTKKAENETRRIIKQFKRKYPNAFLVVIGCGGEAKIKKIIDLPKANLYLSNKEKEKIDKILKEKFPFKPSPPVNFQTKFEQVGRALIKIQEGCNHRCSYCIVPFVRGKSKSIPEEKIAEEINQLKTKIKEAILVGTAISQWGRDLKPQKNLLDLLKYLLEKTSVPKITLSSLDPEILDEKFTRFFAQENRLSPFLHLSLQSGSLKVLRDMGRKLNFNQLNKSIQLIKQKRPEFVLRADIIVGFPTETEEDLKKTIQLIKKIKIAFAHVFPFSPRPKTLAFEKIKKGEWQDMPKEIKRRRSKIIRKETEKIKKEIANNLKGKILNCLIFNKINNNFWKGIAENSFPIKIKGRKIQQGELIKAKIKNFKKGFLYVEK